MNDDDGAAKGAHPKKKSPLWRDNPRLKVVLPAPGGGRHLTMSKEAARAPVCLTNKSHRGAVASWLLFSSKKKLLNFHPPIRGHRSTLLAWFVPCQLFKLLARCCLRFSTFLFLSSLAPTRDLLSPSLLLALPCDEKRSRVSAPNLNRSAVRKKFRIHPRNLPSSSIK